MPCCIIQLQGSLLLERYHYRHSSIVLPGSGCKQSPFAIVPYLSTGTVLSLLFASSILGNDSNGMASVLRVKKAVDAFSGFGVVGLIFFCSLGGAILIDFEKVVSAGVSQRLFLFLKRNFPRSFFWL